MSSNVTKTEEQSVPKEVQGCPKRGSKRHNFNRNPSMEKIKRFNSYICSQNYYILPALLAWLKTSQTVLQSYAEKCIYFVKSLIYHTILYKTLESKIRLLSTNIKDVSLTNPKQLVHLVEMLVSKIYDSMARMYEDLRLKILAAAVYSAFFVIFSQLLACVYALSLVEVPGGLTFLLAATSYISYLNYSCLRFILIKKALKESDKENRCDNSVNEKYIRPKNILGKRTISNLNLF